MDKVRFGRALGTGAREAARALVRAADAATAENPRATPQAAAPAAAPAPPPSAARPMAAQVERARTASVTVQREGKRFGEAAWGPVARASGVLWLEVTGVLFGMFAVVTGIWVWNQRHDLFGAGVDRQRAWFGVLMFVFFSWCTVSSYVRAARRSRR